MPVGNLNNEDLAGMAKVIGLDPGDPDLEDVLVWARRFLAATDPLEELDLAGVEPDLLFVPGKGTEHGQ